jgi:hypothetical protein
MSITSVGDRHHSYSRQIGKCWFMPCTRCASGKQAEFGTEMVIHPSGLKKLDMPGVFVFPKVLVCLDCGFSQFNVPKSELALLARGTPANGAATR